MVEKGELMVVHELPIKTLTIASNYYHFSYLRLNSLPNTSLLGGGSPSQE
jgi:hypothetical protein